MDGRASALAAIATACLLAACEKTPETSPEPIAGDDATPAATSPQAAPEQPPESPGPTISPREETTQTASTGQAPIATQPGPSGSTWHLTSARVTGQILTLQFSVDTSAERSVTMLRVPLDQISLIDDTTSQSYSLLQEDGGRYMAAPLNPAGKQLAVSGSRGEKVVVWLKYPAPPAGSDQMSLTLPGVGAFDGIR